MVADLAPPTEECGHDLPAWLRRLDEARITGAMRRTEWPGRTPVSYLLEIAIPSAMVTTAIVRLRDCGERFVVTDLHTMAASIGETAEWQYEKFETTNPRHYETVPVDEAVGVIRRALVRWMIHECDRCHDERPFPGWPLTAPELAWILGLETAERQDEAA